MNPEADRPDPQRLERIMTSSDEVLIQELKDINAQLNLLDVTIPVVDIYQGGKALAQPDDIDEFDDNPPDFEPNDCYLSLSIIQEDLNSLTGDREERLKLAVEDLFYVCKELETRGLLEYPDALPEEFYEPPVEAEL